MSAIVRISDKFMDDLSRDEDNQLLADHRFDIIYPILRREKSMSLEKALRAAVALDYVHPLTGKLVKYSKGTIKRWYYAYLNSGNKRRALFKKERDDKGSSRTLTPSQAEFIIETKKEFPKKCATRIFEELTLKYNFNGCEKTISNFIREQKLNFKVQDEIQRLPFIMEFANQLVFADTNAGPYLKIDGKSVKTYLITFEDDASRLALGGRYFLNDNSVNVQAVLKESVIRWGVGDLYYFDQGTPYKNKQLSRIIKTIGSNIAHAAPYTPQSKGPEERFFKTVDTRWLNNVHHSDFRDLEHLNSELLKYINVYNNTVHSALGMTPYERWSQDADRITYLDNTNIDAYFLHMERRVVNNDSTIKIHKKQLVVPLGTPIKTKINVFFTPDIDDDNHVYMVPNSKTNEYVVIDKVDKLANGKRFHGSKGNNDKTTAPALPKIPSLKVAKDDFAVEKPFETKKLKLKYGKGD